MVVDLINQDFIITKYSNTTFSAVTVYDKKHFLFELTAAPPQKYPSHAITGLRILTHKSLYTVFKLKYSYIWPV